LTLGVWHYFDLAMQPTIQGLLLRVGMLMMELLHGSIQKLLRSDN